MPRRRRRSGGQGRQLRRPARRRRSGRAGGPLRRRGRRRARLPRHHRVERPARHDRRRGRAAPPTRSSSRSPSAAASAASTTPGRCCGPAPTRSRSTPRPSSDPPLITELPTEFGAQCVVVAIDARRGEPDSDAPTKSGYEVFTHGGRTPTGVDVGVVGQAGRAAGRGRDPAHVDGPRRHPGRLRPRAHPGRDRRGRHPGHRQRRRRVASSTWSTASSRAAPTPCWPPRSSTSASSPWPRPRPTWPSTASSRARRSSAAESDPRPLRSAGVQPSGEVDDELGQAAGAPGEEVVGAGTVAISVFVQSAVSSAAASRAGGTGRARRRRAASGRGSWAATMVSTGTTRSGGRDAGTRPARRGSTTVSATSAPNDQPARTRGSPRRESASASMPASMSRCSSAPPPWVALGSLDAPEVEAQRGQAGVGQRAEQLAGHERAHRAALGRMRVGQHHRAAGAPAGRSASASRLSAVGRGQRAGLAVGGVVGPWPETVPSRRARRRRADRPSNERDPRRAPRRAGRRTSSPSR